MCLTNNEDYLKRLTALNNQGRQGRGWYVHEQIGYNFRMCLPAGTKVLTQRPFNWHNQMAQGVTQRLSPYPIEKIKVGDIVLSFNEKTGKKELKKVTGTNILKDNQLIRLYFSNGNQLALTSNHPVFIHGKGWVEAQKICIGDQAIQYNYPANKWRIHSLLKRGHTLEQMYGVDKANRINTQHGKRMEELRADPLSPYNNSPIFNTPEMHKKQGETLKRVNKERDLYPTERRKLLADVLRKRNLDPTDLNDPEMRQRMAKGTSEGRKRRFQADPEFAKRNKELCRELMKLVGRKPTKIEKELEALLNQHLPNIYKYVGDGKFWIEGANPDFINVNGYKKAIEIYSPYWKIRDYGSIEEYQKIRGALFKKYGWDVLFLEAGRNIKDAHKEEIIKKVLDFTYNPNTELVTVVKKENLSIECDVYNLDVEDNNNFYAYGILVHNTDLAAGIGLAQLTKLDYIIAQKKHIEKRYRELLQGVVGLPVIDADGFSVPFRVNIFVDNPEGLMAHLAEKGVASMRFFYPLHRQPCYPNYDDGEFLVSDYLYEHGLSLPSWVGLTDEQIEYICQVIKEYALK